MADIFISYARADRHHAEALAGDLKAKGYSVWWDAELVGSDDFYEVILYALKSAKAAIVIWSEAAGKSRFVRDEARFALHLDKLVATMTPGMDTMNIPFGFQGQHTDSVTDVERICRALAKLGAQPFAAESDRTARSAESLVELVAIAGDGGRSIDRKQALKRLEPLLVADEANSSASSVRAASLGKFAAFWRGLTFLLPEYMPAASGKLGRDWIVRQLPTDACRAGDGFLNDRRLEFRRGGTRRGDAG